MPSLEVVSGLEASAYTLQRNQDGTLSKKSVAFLRNFSFTRGNDSIVRTDVNRSAPLSYYKGRNPVSGTFQTDSFLELSALTNSPATNYVSNGAASLKVGTQAVTWTQTANVTATAALGYDQFAQTWGNGAGAGNSFHIQDTNAAGFESLSQTFNVPFVPTSTNNTVIYESSLQKQLYFYFAYRNISGVGTAIVTGTNTETGATVELANIPLSIAGDEGSVGAGLSLNTRALNRIDQLTVTFTTQLNAAGFVDNTNLGELYISNVTVGESLTNRFVDRTKTLELEDMVFIEYDMPLTSGDTARFLFIGVEFGAWSYSDPDDVSSETIAFSCIDVVHIDPVQAANGLSFYGDGFLYGETVLGGS